MTNPRILLTEQRVQLDLVEVCLASGVALSPVLSGREPFVLVKWLSYGEDQIPPKRELL